MITKQIISYKSYKDEQGYEVKVYDDKSIIVVCPPLSTEFSLQDLPEHRSEAIQPLMQFVEADLQHNFTPPEDEIE
jgi:hypothetical protein